MGMADSTPTTSPPPSDISPDRPSSLSPGALSDLPTELPADVAGAVVIDPERPEVLHLQGDIDIGVIGLTGGRDDDRLAAVEVVDASRVTFIDSTGINFLITAAAAARDRGVTLQLRDPAPLVTVLVEVMGLQTLFETHITATT